MAATRRKARPDEKFYGTSGVVMLRGLNPSNKKQAKPSTKSGEEDKKEEAEKPATKTISEVTEEALQQAGLMDEFRSPTGEDSKEPYE